jgi:ABC-type transport system involved in cytochrome bd biosynthesis fused ATPase/permease subunit
MIFANIYDKTKNVWWNILAHIYYNFLILILGLFVSPYLPDTFYSIWPAIIMSGISVVAVWYLFKMPALSYKADDSRSKELTDEQKAERKRTADIVDQVMNEQKEEKKNRYRNITSVTDENDINGYDADSESNDTDDDVYDIESDVKRTLLKHSQE